MTVHCHNMDLFIFFYQFEVVSVSVIRADDDNVGRRKGIEHELGGKRLKESE